MACRVLQLVMLLLLIPLAASAQCPGATTTLVPFATEQVVVSASVTSLTQAIYKPSGVTPILAIVSTQGGTIHYLEVGTPTPTYGHTVASPATFAICGIDSIAGFKAIRLNTDTTLTITYYKLK